jgi:glycyl-tRNA synthetase
VIPAYDYLLKCNHTFNILDTRGAVGVTERAGYFRRMRLLARNIAQAYVDQRQRLEYPWLVEDESRTAARVKQPAMLGAALAETYPTTPAPLLVEIGSEELPYSDLEDALEQLRQQVPQMLQSLRLEYDQVKILGTPRRLIIYVPRLAPFQSDLEEVVKGPPAKRAFDAAGSPTQAAEGFARSKGVSVADLQVREMDGGEYVVAIVRSRGLPAQKLLSKSLPELLSTIQFGKSMRWNWTNVPFSRPVRWLLALYGEVMIPFEFAGLGVQKQTRGLRFIDPLEIAVENAAVYFEKIESQGILLDPDKRKSTVEEKINQAASTVDGELLPDTDLLLEVTHLVEAPSTLVGDFDPRHLELPQEVLVGVMKKHQRYFPIYKNGKLLPHFVVVVNKPEGMPLEAVKLGNEDVVRARFADAAYFIREDLKTPLEDFVPQLDRLVFQTDLGSMLDKTHRVLRLLDGLIPLVGLSPEEAAVARRAAELCKADLATQMVVEMTSLQGVIGREYALASGEKTEVATAIFEHYLPRSAEDALPETKPGLVISLADRLDSLAGLFAAGLAPTGNKDPFAQRRAALGLVGNLIAWDLDFDLNEALAMAAANLPIAACPESLSECAAFIIERLRYLLLERDYRYDVVDAVLAAQGHNPASAARAAAGLTNWVSHPDWGQILPAYARCVRITRPIQKEEPFSVREQRFEHEAEIDLYRALVTAESARRVSGSVDDFFNAFLPMIPAINTFFDQVLVMAEDQVLRENRLGLLQRTFALADGVADLSKLEGF